MLLYPKLTILGCDVKATATFLRVGTSAWTAISPVEQEWHGTRATDAVTRLRLARDMICLHKHAFSSMPSGRSLIGEPSRDKHLF